MGKRHSKKKVLEIKAAARAAAERVARLGLDPEGVVLSEGMDPVLAQQESDFRPGRQRYDVRD